MSDKAGARRLDVRDDEKQPLDRARGDRCDALAENHRARRSGRCHLHATPAVAGPEISVQPPSQASVKIHRAIDVGYWDDDDLEFRFDCPMVRQGAGLAARLRTHHGLRWEKAV